MDNARVTQIFLVVSAYVAKNRVLSPSRQPLNAYAHTYLVKHSLKLFLKAPNFVRLSVAEAPPKRMSRTIAHNRAAILGGDATPTNRNTELLPYKLSLASPVAPRRRCHRVGLRTCTRTKTRPAIMELTFLITCRGVAFLSL